MKYAISSLLILAVVSACGEGEQKKDYAAIARCNELGLKAGMPGYDNCIKEEKASRMLKQQRQEYEQMKQDERDWKMRRY